MTHYHYHYHVPDPQVFPEPESLTLDCPQCRSAVSAIDTPVLFLNKSECPVCLDAPIEQILSCGHGLCVSCTVEVAKKQRELQEEDTETADESDPFPSWSSVGYTQEALMSMVTHAPEHALVASFNLITDNMYNVYNSSCGFWAEEETDGDKIYMRKAGVDHETEVFVLHSDMRGQYGILLPGTDHRPFVSMFKGSYAQIFLPNNVVSAPIDPFVA